MKKFNELYESIMLNEWKVTFPPEISSYAHQEPAPDSIIRRIFRNAASTRSSAIKKFKALVGKDVKTSGGVVWVPVEKDDYYLNFIDIVGKNISIIDIEVNKKSLGYAILDTKAAYKDLDDRSAARDTARKIYKYR